MRSRLHLLLIPLAALFCVLPLLLHGCSCGHDLDFHLISWLEAAKQLVRGNLHPHWAYTPAFGAGEPRFVFYPPLSWTIGALITLLLNHLPALDPIRAFAFAPILYTALALCTSGMAMYALARRYTKPAPALFAATLYLSNPYMLFTAYERTAYAELLAATWIPLLLLAMLPAPDPPYPRIPRRAPASRGSSAASETTFDNSGIDRPISVLLLASAVALLWLTNAPAAVMGCYLLALLSLLRLIFLYRKHRSLHTILRPLRQIVAGTFLGLALAAFYILPAAYERRWVLIDMANIPGMRIPDNTLFHHTQDAAHDAVLHTASLIAIALLCLTTGTLVATWIITKNRLLATNRKPAIGFSTSTATANPASPNRSDSAQQPDSNILVLLSVLSALTVAIAFSLTPLSLAVWRYAPELGFLQFPWRILAILAAALCFAAALLLRSLAPRASVTLCVALLLPALLTLGAYKSFRQFCERSETPQAQFAAFHSSTGTEPTDEYTPKTADNDSLRPGNPPFRLTTGMQNSSTSVAAVPSPGEVPLHFDLNVNEPEELVLNLRDFPAWRIDRNGAPVTERLERDDGLITFTVPPGHSHIDISYRTTPDQEAGDVISVIALCLFAPLACLSLRRRASSSRAPHVP